MGGLAGFMRSQGIFNASGEIKPCKSPVDSKSKTVLSGLIVPAEIAGTDAGTISPHFIFIYIFQLDKND
jgi:hypothetical protein